MNEITEVKIQIMQNFWTAMISWDIEKREEINKDIPLLLTFIACILGSTDKIEHLQNEYGSERVYELANTPLTPWVDFWLRQFDIPTPNQRPPSPTSINEI
tara:strand:- start:18 stop:320 length:303 start_codon:yes stop_codon:yes gene_type:complete